MIVGYARISSISQSLLSQTDELQRAGCEQIFEESFSAEKKERPERERLLEWLRPGDTIVVTRVDRLAFSLSDLVKITMRIRKKGAHLRVLNQNLDTSGTQGDLICSLIETLAEFERDIIRERTLKGLETARTRGKNGGRPAVITKDKARAILSAYNQKQLSIAEICRQFGIGKSSVYRFKEAQKRGEL